MTGQAQKLDASRKSARGLFRKQKSIVEATCAAPYSSHIGYFLGKTAFHTPASHGSSFATLTAKEFLRLARRGITNRGSSRGHLYEESCLGSCSSGDRFDAVAKG